MGDDQYEFINPPAKPGDAPNSKAPSASAANPADTESADIQSNLKTDLSPSAMPEAKDFGQSACTSPMPPVDAQTQKDSVIAGKSHVKRRSTCGMVISGVFFFIFVGIAIGGALCVVFKLNSPI